MKPEPLRFLTIIESPYSGDVALNLLYARLCLLDSLSHGETPFASHLLYPQVLDDTIPDQRLAGMLAGFRYYSIASHCVLYTDLGISAGMRQGRRRAVKEGIWVAKRNLFPTATSLEEKRHAIQQKSLQLPHDCVTPVIGTGQSVP